MSETSTAIRPLPPSAATLAKYAISADQWLEILARQGGCCAICRQVPSAPKKAKSKRGGVTWKGPRLCVDHEHIKGWKSMRPELRRLHVRGLVCFWCNKSYLGRSISVVRAQAVVAYLLEHSERMLRSSLGVVR